VLSSLGSLTVGKREGISVSSLRNAIAILLIALAASGAWLAQSGRLDKALADWGGAGEAGPTEGAH
jgi:hypothetical protein